MRMTILEISARKDKFVTTFSEFFWPFF